MSDKKCVESGCNNDVCEGYTICEKCLAVERESERVFNIFRDEINKLKDEIRNEGGECGRIDILYKNVMNGVYVKE